MAVALRPRLALLVVLAALFGAPPSKAQYLNAYKTGLDAVEAQNWEVAASAMAEAIAERPDEKMKLPVRFFLRPYVPHFYLGYARFKSGDCAGALAAWAESQRQGVLAKLPEADLARRGRDDCEQRARQREIGEARQDARQLLAQTSVEAAALLDLARDELVRDVWRMGSPSPSSRHADGLALMRQARELLGDAGVDQDAILRAEALVRDAGAIFAGVRADVDSLVEKRRLALTEKGQDIDAQVAAARDALARTSYLAPYPRLIRKARADLEGLIQEAQRRAASSQAYLDGLAARLENSIDALEDLAVAPPDLLDEAATAYLRGRHGEVVAALAEARFQDRRARAHARLLLAASRHALYLEGGELDEEQRSAAADDARACRRDDARLTPTDRFFSPRFIAFFEASVASTSTPSSQG